MVAKVSKDKFTDGVVWSKEAWGLLKKLRINTKGTLEDWKENYRKYFT